MWGFNELNAPVEGDLMTWGGGGGRLTKSIGVAQHEQLLVVPRARRYWLGGDT